MKIIPATIQTILDSGLHTLSICWKITTTTGTIMRYTEHDEDIVLDEGGLVTYKSSAAFKRTAINLSEGLAVDNLDISGFVSTSDITEAKITSGIFDYAYIEIFFVAYSDVGAGKVMMMAGYLGEFTVDRKEFTAHMNGLTQVLDQSFGESTSPDCRAVFGDARCKFNAAAVQRNGTVISVTNQKTFVINPDPTSIHLISAGNKFFYNGKLTWVTGANAGTAIEVKSADGATGPSNIDMVIQLPMNGLILAGDTFTLTAGCDHSKDTCLNRFNNVVNFVGEPYLPGQDKMLASGI